MKLINFISLAILLLLTSCNACNPPKPTGFGGLKEILIKRDLHLVEYKYFDMIFLHKKDNADKKLKMIVKFPVSISANIDLKRLTIDTTAHVINVPAPVLNMPVVSFQDAEFIKVRDGFLVSFSGSQSDILQTLQARIKDSQARIKANAISLGMIEQTNQEAKSFISDLLDYFKIADQYSITTNVGDDNMEIVNQSENMIIINDVEYYSIEIDDELERIIDQ